MLPLIAPRSGSSSSSSSASHQELRISSQLSPTSRSRSKSSSLSSPRVVSPTTSVKDECVVIGKITFDLTRDGLVFPSATDRHSEDTVDKEATRARRHVACNCLIHDLECRLIDERNLLRVQYFMKDVVFGNDIFDQLEASNIAMKRHYCTAALLCVALVLSAVFELMLAKKGGSVTLIFAVIFLMAFSILTAFGVAYFLHHSIWGFFEWRADCVQKLRIALSQMCADIGGGSQTPLSVSSGNASEMVSMQRNQGIADSILQLVIDDSSTRVPSLLSVIYSEDCGDTMTAAFVMCYDDSDYGKIRKIAHSTESANLRESAGAIKKVEIRSQLLGDGTDEDTEVTDSLTAARRSHASAELTLTASTIHYRFNTDFLTCVAEECIRVENPPMAGVSNGNGSYMMASHILKRWTETQIAFRECVKTTAPKLLASKRRLIVLLERALLTFMLPNVLIFHVFFCTVGIVCDKFAWKHNNDQNRIGISLLQMCALVFVVVALLFRCGLASRIRALFQKLRASNGGCNGNGHVNDGTEEDALVEVESVQSDRSWLATIDAALNQMCNELTFDRFFVERRHIVDPPFVDESGHQFDRCITLSFPQPESGFLS